MVPIFSQNVDPSVQNVKEPMKKREMRAPERTNMKIMKNTTIRCPPKLDFDAPSSTESQLPLFQICSDCNNIGGPKPSKLTPVGAYGSKKIEGERFRKHIKNVTTKVPTSVTNMPQKEGPPKVIL